MEVLNLVNLFPQSLLLSSLINDMDDTWNNESS